MEDALVLLGLSSLNGFETEVLILVLMEDALVRNRACLRDIRKKS